jgi:hypothetical protein
MHWVQCSGPVKLNGLIRDELPHLIVGEQVDLVHLVGGTEAIEEVNEGQAASQGCDVGNQGKVMGLLHCESAQHGGTSLTNSHDITVASEDGQSLASNFTCGHMDDTWQEFSGDLVDVGNHQKKSL